MKDHSLGMHRFLQLKVEMSHLDKPRRTFQSPPPGRAHSRSALRSRGGFSVFFCTAGSRISSLVGLLPTATLGFVATSPVAAP